MLSTPQYGWSEITIGNWHDRCSYLDDVPFMLIETLDATINTGRPHCAKFDAEGYEYIIVFDVYATHIIHDDFDDEYYYYTVEINIRDLAMELLSDIRKDLDSWTNWMLSGSEEENCWRKKKLAARCDAFERKL